MDSQDFFSKIKKPDAALAVFFVTVLAYCVAYMYERGYVSAFGAEAGSAQVVYQSFFSAVGLLGFWVSITYMMARGIAMLSNRVISRYLPKLGARVRGKQDSATRHAETVAYVCSLVLLPPLLLMTPIRWSAVDALNVCIFAVFSILVAWAIFAMIAHLNGVMRIASVTAMVFLYTPALAYTIGYSTAASNGIGAVTTIKGKEYGLVRDYGNKIILVQIYDHKYLSSEFRYAIDESIDLEHTNAYKHILRP